MGQNPMQKEAELVSSHSLIGINPFFLNYNQTYYPLCNWPYADTDAF